MGLAVVSPSSWACRAIPSWHSSHWWVQVEHDESEQGGWVRYALTLDRSQGLAYFSTRKAAEAAMVEFLHNPSLARCCTQ